MVETRHRAENNSMPHIGTTNKEPLMYGKPLVIGHERMGCWGHYGHDVGDFQKDDPSDPFRAPFPTLAGEQRATRAGHLHTIGAMVYPL